MQVTYTCKGLFSVFVEYHPSEDYLKRKKYFEIQYFFIFLINSLIILHIPILTWYFVMGVAVYTKESDSWMSLNYDCIQTFLTL